MRNYILLKFIGILLNNIFLMTDLKIDLQILLYIQILVLFILVIIYNFNKYSKSCLFQLDITRIIRTERKFIKISS